MKLNFQFHCILIVEYFYFVCAFQHPRLKKFLTTYSYTRQSSTIECEANNCKKSFVKCIESYQTCFITCWQCSQHFNTPPFTEMESETVSLTPLHIISHGELLGELENSTENDKPFKKQFSLRNLIRESQAFFSQIKKEFKKKPSLQHTKEDKKEEEEEEEEDDSVLDYWDTNSHFSTKKETSDSTSKDTKDEEKEVELKEEEKENIKEAPEIVPKLYRYKMHYKPSTDGLAPSLPKECLSTSSVNFQISILLRPEGNQPPQSIESTCVIEGSFFSKTNPIGFSSSTSPNRFFRFTGRLKSKNVFIIKTSATIEKKNLHGSTPKELNDFLQKMVHITFECAKVERKGCIFDILKSYVRIGCAKTIGWKEKQAQRIEKMIQHHNQMQEKLLVTFKNAHETVHQLYQKELKRRNEILKEHENSISAPDSSETKESTTPLFNVSHSKNSMDQVPSLKALIPQTNEKPTQLLSSGKSELIAKSQTTEYVSDDKKQKHMHDDETEDVNGVITSRRIPYNDYKMYYDKYMRAKLYKLDA